MVLVNNVPCEVRVLIKNSFRLISRGSSFNCECWCAWFAPLQAIVGETLDNSQGWGLTVKLTLSGRNRAFMMIPPGCVRIVC